MRCWQISWMDLTLMPTSRKSYKDFVFVEDCYSSLDMALIAEVSLNINIVKHFYYQILTVSCFIYT